MSEIGGIEAVKEVRKIQEKYNREHGLNQRVPIISLSDSNKKEFIMELLNNDIDDYLTKNCSGEDVIRLVKFWIDY
jgi:CheY-like chemotaxis protein